MFHQGVTINNCTHVPVPVDQSIDESEYNEACTTGMALVYFKMINYEFLNKDPDVV